jgi:hypothetical protein
MKFDTESLSQLVQRDKCGFCVQTQVAVHLKTAKPFGSDAEQTKRPSKVRSGSFRQAVKVPLAT